jgi:ribonuclease BN (tRNA processing enzyme)
MYLIHYPTGRFERSGLIQEAKSVFNGEVELAKDFMEIIF